MRERREFHYSDRELLQMMSELRVGPSVDDKGLRLAFFEQIKEHHTDRGGDPEKSKKVTQAYRVLKGYIDSGVLLPSPPSTSGGTQQQRQQQQNGASRSGCRPSAQAPRAAPDGFEDFGDFQDVGGKKKRHRNRRRGPHPDWQQNESGEEGNDTTRNGSSANPPGQGASRPQKFVNNYIYEPDDFSTYDDPMERRDRQKDGLRRIRGGLILYKDFQRSQNLHLPDEYQELGTVYTEDDLTDNPIFGPVLEKLRVTSEELPAFAEKLRTYVYICWAFDGGASQDARIVLQRVRLEQLTSEDDALYEIKIPAKNFDTDLLTEGLHVEVRSPTDARMCASAVVEKVKLDTQSLVVFFVEPLRLIRILALGRQVNVAINASAFTYRSQLRSIEYVLTAKHGRDMAQLVFPKPEFTETFEEFSERRTSEIGALSFREEGEHAYNEEQKYAIHAILTKAHAQWPFILFGPPGTGKTITLIEAIRQIAAQSAQNRVLVCTPSKMAADNFSEALLEHNFLHPKYIFRMHSQSTMAFNRNKRLDPISYLAKEAKNRFFGIPDRHNLKMFRVLICTLSTSAYLVSAGGFRGYFTHLIVDESGQATEPDLWIPLGGLVGLQTSVVLAGDPKQLGPVVRPENLKQFGFDHSMLKRIMYRDEYQQADERVFVTLCQTYRSHYSILRPCSYLFYDNVLKVDDGQGEFHKLSEWTGLPQLGFPIIFHSSLGSSDEQGGNKSHQNQFEAELVCKYVERLLHETDTHEKNIGVISPYRNQVNKLKQMLAHRPSINVDSVEGFQGSEREVIIMSTVRQMEIGFLRCDLRLNTSISRAKYLLIVIGNERILSHHLTWKKFIYYCRFHGGFVNKDGERVEAIESGDEEDNDNG